jgi:hypothetical protein
MSYTKEKRPADAAEGSSGETAVEAGQNKVEASYDRGRRWYHLRPKPRDRADLMGFNRSWWTILLFILVVL